MKDIKLSSFPDLVKYGAEKEVLGIRKPEMRKYIVEGVD